MALTHRQESFCLAYLETGNATEAYRRSYSASNMKPSVVNVKACEMLAEGKIRERLEELRAPVRQKAQISLEQHLNDLKRLRDLAEKSEKYGPAIIAETNRGKASGLYAETLNVNVNIGIGARLDRARKLLDGND